MGSGRRGVSGDGYDHVVKLLAYRDNLKAELAKVTSSSRRHWPDLVARIRYLKPHIWTSKDIVRLSAIGRLVFVVMITQADDEGRLHTDPYHLATVHLSGSGASTVEVAFQLKLMQRLRMVQQYRGQFRGVLLCNP